MGSGCGDALGLALAHDCPASATDRPVFVSAYDRLHLRQLAAEELAACDAGDLAEALRLSELYEAAEKKAFGL